MKQEKIIEKQVERSCLHCKYFRAGRRKSLEDVLKNMKKIKKVEQLETKLKNMDMLQKKQKEDIVKMNKELEALNHILMTTTKIILEKLKNPKDLKITRKTSRELKKKVAFDL